jgi:predicted O-methyltransferase YrrM
MFATPEEARCLRKIVNEISSESSVIVEIGTGRGGGTIVIANSLKTDNGTIYTIDKRENPFLTFDMPDKRINFLRGDSVEISNWFDNGSIDFIYFDGSYTYNGLIADLKAWLPKIKNNGIVCGHDCVYRFENFDKIEQELIRKYQHQKNLLTSQLVPNNRKIVQDDQFYWLYEKWYGKLPHAIHPGVICGLYDFFGKDYVTFKEMNSIWLLQ